MPIAVFYDAILPVCVLASIKKGRTAVRDGRKLLSDHRRQEMAAAAIPVTAAQGTGQSVLEAKHGPGQAPGQTLNFAGSAATRGKGALDEELHIQGNRWAHTRIG